MPIPDFIIELRRTIGHAPLWLAGITAVVIRDRKVLLVKRSELPPMTADMRHRIALSATNIGRTVFESNSVPPTDSFA